VQKRNQTEIKRIKPDAARWLKAATGAQFAVKTAGSDHTNRISHPEIPWNYSSLA
jgi:hypothetical protein